MTPQLAISILPDGSHELIDPALLAGIDTSDIVVFDGSPAADAALVGWNRDGGPGFPQIDHRVSVQARYIEMRLKGEKHPMAELLAVRKFPSFKTDSTFNKGRVNGSQFEDCPLRGDWLRARAEEAGVSTTGKFYSSGLARFPGDPKAWVSNRNDVLRVARENGMSVSGDVNYTAPETDPGADLAVAPEILAREVDAYMAANPDARRGDAEETVREVITGQVDKHEPLVEA
jgi:hypothetical protein